MSLMALTLAGCEAMMVDDIAPDNPGFNSGESDDNNPKRPVPIKPKRNPGGKIERPKAIEDLINQIITPGRLSHDDTLVDEPR